MIKTKALLHLILLVLCCISFNSIVVADGLPSEHYVTQRWRDIFSGHSPTLNPAFMTEENYLSFRMAISPTLGNSFLLMEAGAIVPVGLYQSIGLSYVGLSSKDDVNKSYFDYTTNQIVATNQMVNDNQNQFMVSYAVNPWNRLSLGANVSLFQKTNFDSAMIGINVDVALSYRLFRHKVLGDHVFGVNLQNLYSSGFSEASNLKISWLAKIWESRIDVGIDMDIKDLLSQAKDFAQDAVAGGSPKTPEYDFNARVGFWIFNIISLHLQAGSNYWGVCPGLNVPTLNMGRDLQIAYQYMSIVDNLDLTSTHTFYIRGELGEHREEIYARRMAKVASLQPNFLYNKARTLYAEGKYWEAFFLFNQLLDDYPDFFKNDWVQLHLGLCQENLDMREASLEQFSNFKKAFPRSEAINYADLGILRINYRDNNGNEVLNQYTRINNSSAPDSLKYHACYYMGMQYMRDGEYKNAIKILTKIPQNHPEYLFAQYSLSVAYASDKMTENVVSALKNIIDDTAKTEEEQEIVNRATILLGYIFFEGIAGVEQSLSQAVAALKKVQPTSYYYEDAQIGKAWVALRAQQWQDCMLACDEILKISNKTTLKCEAMLLKGYCFLIDKKYQEAVDILTLAQEQIQKFSVETEQDKEKKTQIYYDNRTAYFDIASAMNDYAGSGSSSVMISKIDSLHVSQMACEKKIRTYFKESDENQRQTFFARSAENLRSDIEFSLAKASKLASEKGTLKIKENVTNKIDKIQDQIDTYEEELKKLKKKE